jgi:predicted secreted protein
LTAGDQSEVWRIRSSCLLKAAWIEFQKVGLDDFVRTDEEVDTTRGEAGQIIPGGENSDGKSNQSPIFSILSLLEMAMMAMFDASEASSNAPLLEKTFLVIETLRDSEVQAQSELTLPSFLQMKVLYDFSKVRHICMCVHM